MNNVDVENSIRTYPKHDDDGKMVEAIKIVSHWNESRLVHLLVGCEDVIVDGNTLITAIRNSMNTG